MARKTRMYLPGVPAHVVQRGHNRNDCFFALEDYNYYLRFLGEGLKRYGAELHSYCLMTNHVHLLITPQETDSISRVMQHVGRRYVQYINKTYQRSGTLWEGRHKGSIVDAENYLIACYRYIELNPVTACIVARPEDYLWSSFRCNALGAANELITPHPIFTALGPDAAARHAAYRALFLDRLPSPVRDSIAQCLSANQMLGGSRFKDQVEAALGCEVGHLRRGRPRGAGGKRGGSKSDLLK